MKGYKTLIILIFFYIKNKIGHFPRLYRNYKLYKTFLFFWSELYLTPIKKKKKIYKTKEDCRVKTRASGGQTTKKKTKERMLVES